MEQEQIDKLIQFRAEGFSYDAIAKKIGVSKPTLLKYSTGLADRIEEYKNIYLDGLAEEYRLMTCAKVEVLGRMLRMAYDALLEVKFTKVPAHKLVEVIFDIQDRLEGVLASRPESSADSIVRGFKIIRVSDGIEDKKETEQVREKLKHALEVKSQEAHDTLPKVD